MSFKVLGPYPGSDEVALLRAPVTDEDVALIRDRGYGVNLLSSPPGANSLEFLAPLAPFLTHLTVSSGRIEDARYVEQMLQLRDLSIAVSTKFTVDVTKIPGLESFGGEYRHLQPALNHPNIRQLFLESFPKATVPLITAPIEYLRINNARKLSELPFLKTPETLTELRVDSARKLSISNAVHYSNLEWLLLDSCREVVDIATVTRMPWLRRLTLIDCTNIDDIDALLSLKGMEICVAGMHPFSPEFQAAAAASSGKWSFPPGRGTYVPPAQTTPHVRPAELYLIHPGLPRPLTVPDEASEDNPWRDALPSAWDELSSGALEARLAAHLGRVLDWARREGADRVEIPIPPYDEDDITTIPMDGQPTPDLVQQLSALDAFSIFSADIELARVWEGLDEGIIVRSNNPRAI